MVHQNKSLLLAVALLQCICIVNAASPPEPPLRRQLKNLPPEQLQELLIPQEEQTTIADIDPALLSDEATGTQEVIVQLRTPSVSAMGDGMTPEECKAYKSMLEQEQSAFFQRHSSATEIGCIHVLLNAVFLTIDAEDIEEMAEDPEVLSIHQVTDFEKSLESRVPYIGATRVQEEFGFDGTGISIAILDRYVFAFRIMIRVCSFASCTILTGRSSVALTTRMQSWEEEEHLLIMKLLTKISHRVTGYFQPKRSWRVRYTN